MNTRIKRLETLEQASGLKGGWDLSKPCHRVIIDEGASYQAALSAYREKNPESPVEPDHNVIWVRIISPVHDEAGSIIPRETDEPPEWPDLAGVLAGRVQ